MRPALAAAAVGAALAAAALPGLSRGWPPFPPLSELPSTPFALQDAALAAAGFRAAAADLAWIQLLQYAAGSVPELPDPPGRPYAHLKDMSLRVAALDPSFTQAYLYGAGILAWFRGVERPDEALEILEAGMRLRPDQPIFALYIAAIAYKKKGENARMLELLESSFDDPRTPSQMKAILANLYKARGEHLKAAELWARILDSERDASEHPRATQQLRELRALIRERRR